MTVKKKPTPPVKLTDTQRKKALAILALDPTHNAAALVSSFSELYGELDFMALAKQLQEQGNAMKGGSLQQTEAMLLAQAQSLDVMFTSLARRGKVQEGLKQYETHMKLALRAQSQCRATLEALATIKNPPVVFAKQANIAHGHQQVNNNANPSTSRAGENINSPNKLLEADHGQRLDTGTTGTAGASHPPMETVGAIHRAQDGSGQGSGER
jgi:hypothetical protein